MTENENEETKTSPETKKGNEETEPHRSNATVFWNTKGFRHEQVDMETLQPLFAVVKKYTTTTFTFRSTRHIK